MSGEDWSMTAIAANVARFHEHHQRVVAERDRLRAALAEREAAGDAMADYCETLVPSLDTYAQRHDVRELIAAWRSLAARSGQHADGPDDAG